MFGFLSFLLILFLLIIFIGFSILGNIMRVLFGGGSKRSNYQSHTYTNHENFNRQQDANDSYAETDSASNTHHKSKGNKRRYSVMTKENMLILRNNNSSPISGYHRLFLKKSFIN